MGVLLPDNGPVSAKTAAVVLGKGYPVVTEEFADHVGVLGIVTIEIGIFCFAMEFTATGSIEPTSPPASSSTGDRRTSLSDWIHLRVAPNDT